MKNYLIIITVLRKLRFNRTLSILNILGLGIGLSVAVIVFLYVNYELSFDRFNKDADNIFLCCHKSGGLSSVFPIPFSEALQNEIPEVQSAGYIFPWDFETTITVPFGEFNERCRYLDENIFKIFSFPILRQSTTSIFSDENSLAISEKLAEKLFGSVENAIGKTIILNKKKNCTITTVFKDIPANSSIRFEMAAPSASYINEFGISTQWNEWNVSSFVKLEVPLNQATSAIAKFSKDHQFEFSLFPLTQFHLSQKSEEQKKTLIIAVVACIFVMLLACINFINLSTANILRNTKEAGINRLLGSSSLTMFKRIMAETFMVMLISLVLAILISLLLLPYLNQLTGTSLSLSQLTISRVLLLFGFIVFTAVLTASIPGYLFSKVRPIQIFNKQITRNHSSVLIRKSLLVLQLSLTVVIITTTLFINKQVRFISKTNLGFNKENMVFIEPNTMKDITQKSAVLKDELLNCPQITSVCMVDCPPGQIGSSTSSVDWLGKDINDNTQVYLYRVSDDFIKTFEVKLIYGKGFDNTSDKNGIIINNTLARKMKNDGVKDLSTIYISGKLFTIAGIIDDFAFNSIKDGQGAVAIFYDPSRGFYPCIRYKSENQINDIFAHINKSISALFPDMAYNLKITNDFILDEFIAREVRLSKFFTLFSILGLLICTMGLLGMALFESQKRTKEIGIRKVNGAQISDILTLLNKDYAVWFFLAFIIAVPVVYYSMDQWLENFAYKTSLSWWIFALAGLMALGIALLTVSWQSWKAATRNPVEALRNE
jgi:putative ABC transport system permease protein